MGNDVFANGRELSCKSGSGKSICAFPDVCFTPPQTPATPPGVPIPYPNTGMGSDTSKGSRDVKITKKEVMMKNKSMFKKSVGDQAGCAPKKGVVTSQTGGKVYFNSWSMDVKIEGENAVRHLDLTTHNHGSVPGNSPTWPYIDQMTVGEFSKTDPCAGDINKEMIACADYQPYKEDGPDPCDAFDFKAKPKDATAAMSKSHNAAAEDCMRARVCQLVPYKATGNEPKCCHGQTGHHLIEAASMHHTGRGLTSASKKKALTITQDEDGHYAYGAKKAPCICVFGTNQYHGTHGLMHAHQGSTNAELGQVRELEFLSGEYDVLSMTYAQARDSSSNAVLDVFPTSGCNKDCIEAQLDAYHQQPGLDIKDDDFVKAVDTGYTNEADLFDAEEIIKAGYQKTPASSATGGRFSQNIN